MESPEVLSAHPSLKPQDFSRYMMWDEGSASQWKMDWKAFVYPTHNSTPSAQPSSHSETPLMGVCPHQVLGERKMQNVGATSPPT